MEPPSASPGRVCLKAIDAASGKETEVLVSHRRMHTVGRRSLGHAAECGTLVPYALQHPNAIFEGLRHDSDEAGRTPGWYCYCCTPPCSFDEDGNRQPPYANQVFLVFVNREKSFTIGGGKRPPEMIRICQRTMINDSKGEHYDDHQQ
jgi:hypothetical protein